MSRSAAIPSRILVVLLLAAFAGPAFAHESEPAPALRFSAVVPEVDGLAVEAREGIAPTLVVTNETGERFEVLGADGVPFLRVGPDAVRANLASPDWWASERPDPGAPPPSTARPGAAPRWVRLAAGAEWAWFEHRLGGAAAVAGASWSIPARLGSRPLRLTGSWETVSVYGTFHSELSGVEPATPGLDVRILPGPIPAVYVENETGLALDVDDADGRPFLRIGPEETLRADPTGVFRRVGGVPRWGWVEPRAGWSGGDPPERLRDAADIVRVSDWSVPARLGGDRIEIRGHLEWVPVRTHHAAAAAPAGGGASGVVFVALTLLAIGALGGLWVANRRRRA